METITFADFALLGIGTIAIAMIVGGALTWVLTYFKNDDQ
jgi:predicted benzoate:H+ symporter BenE